MENERRYRRVWVIVGIVLGLLFVCGMSAVVGGTAGYLAGKRASQGAWRGERIEIHPGPWHDEDLMPKLPERLRPEAPGDFDFEFGPGMGFGGALIVEVVDGSPAERAGLRQGDIITQVDGMPLEGEEDMGDILSTFEPGEQIQMLIMRGGREREVMVQLGRHPDRGGETPWLGITYREMPRIEFHMEERPDKRWRPRR